MCKWGGGGIVLGLDLQIIKDLIENEFLDDKSDLGHFVVCRAIKL